jgi:hypothetical protein
VEPLYRPIKATGVSYETWVHGICMKKIWGDEMVLAVVSMMWNVAITVITATDKIKIYHNRKQADLYLLANGVAGNLTHFSGTCKYLTFID